ncbi:hypothetical protein LJR219_003703 [Phenylobacterium sp. LjRoot219]|uniref:MauE/DoxX family redox-associated membrane protein n=1 Tax=Phenylobacterium sp. LjRoot219 TaxID=3342283 RepID=UPI003ECD83E6
MLPAEAAALQVAIRVAVALIFLTSAWGKARRLPDVVEAVRNYRLLPERLTIPSAMLLPIAEALAGGALLVDPFCQQGAVLAGALLLLFALAIGVNLARGRRAIDCGCDLSGRGQPISWRLVARNLGLTALLAFTLAPARPVAPAVWAAAAATAALAFCLYLALHQLWSVAAPRPVGASGVR